ncbi:MAG: hypothetical protein GY792_05220 [Gammaproteobacteria bacterium]|nr:hypothetical protein [Gammaproteobacteria bacterium]
MEIDFSSLNLQYLIQAREIAKKSPELAVAILGLPVELVNLLASLTAEGLSMVTRIKVPLLTLRCDSTWWSRLFTALKEQRSGEVDVVLELACLAVVVNQ